MVLAKTDPATYVLGSGLENDPGISPFQLDPALRTYIGDIRAGLGA
jgi:hypothetical protein